MKKIFVKAFAVVAFVALPTSALAQLVQRPRDPNTGKSAGVAYALDCENDVVSPAHGEICVDLNVTAAGTPGLRIYDGESAAWSTVTVDLAGGNTWTGLNVFDRAAAGVDVCFGGAEDTANTICIDGDTGDIIFEGATTGANEINLDTADPGADVTYRLADAAAGTYGFITSTLATNAPEIADSVFGGTSQLIFEGGSANVAEIIFTANDTAGDLNIDFGIPGTAASGEFFEIEGTILVADGGETISILNLDVGTIAPSAGTNTLVGLEFDAITARANLDEVAVRIGAGWTQGVFLPDGAAATPALSFTTDTDTGFFSMSADQVGLSLGGAHVFEFDELPAATGGAVLFSVGSAEALPAITSGIVRFLHVNVVSTADHVGGTIRGIDVASITQDAQATETGILVNDGWDAAIHIQDGTINDDIIALGNGLLGADGAIFWTAVDTLTFNNAQSSTGEIDFDMDGATVFRIREVVAGAGASWVDVLAPVSIMDNTDTQNALDISITNVNHTGTGNTLNLLNIGAITGDANANLNAINIGALTGTVGAAGEVETAINIGEGWDAAIRVLADGSATDDAICLGAGGCAVDSAIYWNSAAGQLLIDVDGTASNGMDLRVGVDSLFEITGSAGVSVFTVDPANPVNNPYNFVDVLVATVNNTNGSGVLLTMMALDFNDLSWASAGTDELRGINIESVVPDVDATYTAIQVNGSTGSWNLSASFDGPVEHNTLRTDFNGFCRRFEAADGTAELVTDAGINAASCDGQIRNFTYRIDGAQTSPFIVRTNSGLDIDNDGADNEGVEILIGASLDGTVDHGLVVGTSPAMYARFNVTITSVSGTDNAYFGWRQSEAFVDNLVIATYDTYGVHLINDNAGNLVIQTGDDTVDGTDENANNALWADAETITLEVQVATDGNFSFYTDGVLDAETNATGAAAAGEILVPVIGLLNAVDADTEMVINWIEIGEVI